MLQQRLKQYLTYKHLSYKSFEDVAGLANASAKRLSKSSRKSTFDRISEAFEDLNIDWLLTGEGEMLKEKPEIFITNQEDVNEGYLVPLIPVSVMAGHLSEFDSEGIDLNRCDRIISPIKGVDMAFPVYGDSMEPEYPAGSQVLVKKINHIDFIPYGNVYVLDTTNGPLLKKVKKSEKDGYIKCVSLNEAAGYEPFNVPLRSVRGMYRVMMCLSIKG